MNSTTVLAAAAITGDIGVISNYINKQSTDQVLQLKTAKTNNNILHLASESGHTDAVQAILSNHSSLLSQVNSDGNTALHFAARCGHTSVVRILIDSAKKNNSRSGRLQTWHDISRLKNNEGDTAVHEAARYNHVQVLTILLQEDPDFNHLTNNLQETPLYIAASRGFHDSVDVIIKSCREEPSFFGPDGRTALHGAVMCNSKDCTSFLLQWRSHNLLYCPDEYSRTPLHYAAHLGLADIVEELLSQDANIGWFTDTGNMELFMTASADHVSVVKDLIAISLYWDVTNFKNRSIYHLGTGKDFFLAAIAAHRSLMKEALFLAASAGHISVMKQLISHCIDCCYLANYKGRNVLHVAIEFEQKDVIEYLLEECPWLINSLIVKKDKDGNTPLHLLATSNCFVPKLINHPMADKGALNKRLFTPLDLAIHIDDDNETNPSTTAPKSEISEELKRVGPISHFWKAPHPPAPATLDFSGYERLRKMTDNHMIVAALIATVAFTAGFAMPGGFIQSGSPNQGMAVLSRNSVAFQAFVVSDVVALLFSSSALFTYFISVLNRRNLNEDVIAIYAVVGMLLNMFGLGSIIVAFITGTYAVLHYSYALAIAASVVASSIFLIHFAILLHFIIYTTRQVVKRF